MKLFRIIFLLLSSIYLAHGQESFGFLSKEVDLGDAFTLDLVLNTQQDIKAIQFDVNWDPTAFTYSNTITLADRIKDTHVVVMNPISGQNNKYRVLIYSSSNAPIPKGEGVIASFAAVTKSVYGSFTANITEAVFSGVDSANISNISLIQGNIQILSPDFGQFPPTFSFGGVYKQTTTTQVFTLSNIGNKELVVSLESTDLDKFSFDTSVFPVSIPAGSNYGLSISFSSDSSGKFTESFEVSSNDPDETENRKVELTADVYSSNTALLTTVEVVDNTPQKVYFSVATEEPVISFQFDVVLPSTGFYFDKNSVRLELTGSNHTISHSFLNEGRKLRVLAYSPTNQAISVSSGNLVSFSVGATDTIAPGSYPLILETVVLNNSNLFNVVTGTTNGSVIKKGSALSYVAPTALPNIPIDYPTDLQLVLRNTGNMPLQISDILQENDDFEWIDEMGEATILPDEQAIFPFQWTPRQQTKDSLTFVVAHNGYTKSDTLVFQANTYAPNFIRIEKLPIGVSADGDLKFQVVNYEEVTGLQFEFSLPSTFTYDIANAVLAPELTDKFSLSISPVENTQNDYQVLMYRLGTYKLPVGSNDLFVLPINAGTTPLGSYPVDPSSAIISNNKNNNISTNAAEVNAIGVTNAPVASSSSITINEDQITTIQPVASDPDGDVLTFVVTQQPVNGVALAVEGGIKYTPTKDYFGTDVIYFKAYDQFLFSSQQSISIEILPVNDAPVLAALPAKSLSEDTAINTLVHVLLATDAEGDVITFELSPQTIAQGVFGLQNANELIVVGELDYEEFSKYNVEVIVSDPESSSTTTVTIDVIDVPNQYIEAPFRVTVYDVKREDLTAKVDYSAYFKSTAKEEGQIVIYSLVPGQDADFFSVDKAFGMINFKEAPDFENPEDANRDNVYEFTLRVTNISDGAPEVPVITAQRNISVPESSTQVAEVSTIVVAVDADTDGDGVPDVQDNCPTTFNPNQADWDNDGTGDVCDDSDQDGLFDSVDQCISSTLGMIIDVFGCEVFTLPGDNISLQSVQTSCVGSGNGKAVFSAIDTDYTYIIAIEGQPEQRLLSANSHQATYSGLNPGSYQACITILGVEGYQQCYSFTVTEPAPLAAASKADQTAKTWQIYLSGSDLYTVNYNGASFQTSEQSIKLVLQPGMNKLEISTDQICQGTFFEEIFVSEKVLAYPNPANEWLQLYVGGNDATVDLVLFDLAGNTVLSKSQEVPQNRVFDIGLSELPSGIYVVSLSGNTVSSQIKIIKE